MRIYNFFSYKEYLTDHIESLPKRGRGQFLRLSKALRVHPTLISQVLSGSKHFSEEQGFRVCGYLGLDDPQSRYFVTMLHYEKAGTGELKDFYKKQLEDFRSQALQVSSQIRTGQELSVQEAAIFYSQWKYSAVRLITSLPRINTRQDIAKHLGLSLREVSTIVSYLLSVGLCIEKNGKLEIGTTVTYLNQDSPYFTNHLTNWRLRAIDQSTTRSKEDLFIAAPMTVSRDDFGKIRGMFLSLFREVSEILQQSPSEEFCCLNIDFFEYKTPE